MTCPLCLRGNICPNCKSCPQCQECGCRTCVKCSTRYRPRKYCHCQDFCRTHCECRLSPGFASEATLGVKPAGKFPHLLSGLPRLLGVELEIGEWKTFPASISGLKFQRVHDWSVKPSEQEMVLAPLRGDAIIRGMLAVSKAATAAGCVVNNSCALHVHVEGKDLSMWELRRLLEVYRHIEPEIYTHMIAPHRQSLPSIHYCQMMTSPHLSRGCDRCERYDRQYPGQRVPPEPLAYTLERMWRARSTSDLKLCLYRMLYGIENPKNYPDALQTRKGGKYEYCRYFGLNLHSWTHRMTVEWRMKEATLSPTELVNWPLWCGWVVHAITRMSDTEARSGKLNIRTLTEKYMPKYLITYVESKGL